MQIRTKIDPTAVKELGKMLSSVTMDLYNVRVHTLRPKTPPRFPGNPKGFDGQGYPVRTKAEARFVYTVNCLDEQERFEGKNSSREALAFILGLLEGKRGLNDAQRKRVKFWADAVREELRGELGHYADYSFHLLSGHNRMVI